MKNLNYIHTKEGRKELGRQMLVLDLIEEIQKEGGFSDNFIEQLVFDKMYKKLFGKKK